MNKVRNPPPQAVWGAKVISAEREREKERREIRTSLEILFFAALTAPP